MSNEIPSNQEVFDKVARHLLTQGRKSTANVGRSVAPVCAYRGDDGGRCAAGIIIPDEIYDKRMEAKGWDQVAIEFPAVRNLGEQSLISDLQDVHDMCIPSQWRSALIRLARNRGLSTAVIDEMEVK